MNLQVTVNDREVLNVLTALNNSISDISPALDQIGSTVSDLVRLTFRDQKSPYGAPWAPLAESTLLGRGRAKAGGKGLRTKAGNTRGAALRAIVSAKILLDTGRLRNSISYRIGAKEVVISATNVAYANTQQFGSRRRKIPARPFFPFQAGQAVLPESWAQRVRDIALSHLKRATRN